MTIKLFPLLILLFFAPVKKKNDLQRENLNGKVKSVTEYGYSGQIHRAHRYTFSISRFDEKGNCTEKLYLTGDSVLMRSSSFKRNALGQAIEEKVVNVNGELDFRYVSKYDLNGNESKTCSFRKDYDGLCFYYQYNKEGLRIKDRRGEMNSEPTLVDYKYDSLGNVIQEIRQSFSLKQTDTTNYTYEKFDLENNWIQQTSHFRKSCNSYCVRRIDYY